MDDFVHVHTHSDSSAFDGLGSEESFARRAAEMGQPAIAFTEHGSIRGLYRAHKACEVAGIKLIPGAELYVVDDAGLKGMTDEEKAEVKRLAARKGANEKEALKAEEKRRRERDHITVWAMDAKGMRNLYRLLAWSWGAGFYYKPRVDLARLKEYGEGLLVSSGCPTGIVSSPLRSGDVATALDRLEALAETFPGRFYVEVMPHVLADDPMLALKLSRLAHRYDLPMIATQDAHYVTPGDSVAHDSFLCIQTRAKMSDPDRFRFSSRNFWLRTRGEMRKALLEGAGLPASIVDKALDETCRFADRVSATVPLPGAGAYLAAPDLPDGCSNHADWLWTLCLRGSRERFGKPERMLPEHYQQRLKHEYDTIKGLNFSAYFVAVWDIRRWAREAGICCGPGRGSAAGSLVSYLLRITDLDPVEHGLLFERFLAPGRGDLPDFDTDYDYRRREEVVEYAREKYGDDRVGHISTRITIGGRAALRDLARIHEIPERDILPVAARVTRALSEDEASDESLRDVLEGTEGGRAFAAQYPDVARTALALEGTLRSTGLHAAGVVIASLPLMDLVPMETVARERGGKTGHRVPVVAWDMEGAEAAGLVKIDFLGLKTLTVVAEACRLVGIAPGDIPPDDPETMRAFTEGRFVGVFQFDSPGARATSKGFVFRRLADVAVITALNRPGPARTGLSRQFIERAADPSRVPSVHPIYDEVFAETLGVPVYQEQIIALVRRLGYSPEEADRFRKKVSKKLGLSDERSKFVAGAVSAGMTEDESDRLFSSIVGFANYAFNKSHSFSYAVIAIWTMYLKVHHLAAFFAASLAVETDAEKQVRLAQEARRCGIPVLPPDVQTSGEGFSLATDDGKVVIVGSVADLKGIGPETARQIAHGKPYLSLLDFYSRTAGRKVRVTSATFATLARIGALRSLTTLPERFIVENAAEIWRGLKEGLTPEVDGGIAPYSPEERLALASEVYPLYSDVEAGTRLEAMEERIALATSRVMLDLSKVDPGKPGVYLATTWLANLKLYPGDDGGRSGRATLSSSSGDEVAVRVDADVIDASAAVFASTGKAVIALLSVSERGRVSVEAIWDTGLALDGHRDSVLAWVMECPATTPNNPARALRMTHEDCSFVVEGMVVRRRSMTDKSGGRMQQNVLLGARGAVKFFVWASRMGRDTRLLRPGNVVRVRLTRLRGDGACLARDEVRTM